MSPDARAAGFSRRHRFTAQGSFAPVLRGGRKLRGRLVVVHVAPGRPGRSRLGIALTRRLVASAVHRNRIKRLVREAFRLHPAKTAGFDLVVTLRERFDPGHLEELVAELRGLLDQLCTAH